MKKFQVLVLFAFILIWFALFLPPPVNASDFNTDANVTYDISEDGETKVTYDISIENANEMTLSKGYVLTLSNIAPKDIAAREDGHDVFAELIGSTNGTDIRVNFTKPAIGVNKKKQVKITFATDTVAKKSGELWEVYIPKLIDPQSFRSYKVTLSVPEIFGDEVYINPKALDLKKTEKGRVYIFDKDTVGQGGVNAAFGKSQVFSFKLTYHLKNDGWKSETQKVAIPADTSTQKIYIENIYPQPMNVQRDDDGNWIAEFTLSSFKQLNITVDGEAQLLGGPRKVFNQTPEELRNYTKPTQYWQADDPKILKLTENLQTPESNSASASSNTAKAIYDYVTKLLSYDYKRTNPDVVRLGAVKAMDHPDSAICMEFTDLFITISRSAGIPAREINGYAYSENPKIQPLSLVSDILHSWPEYWDSTREVWIPIDPTWGKTTDGQDYFNSFDMKHIAFVVHGMDDSNPKPPGSYKTEGEAQKDVFVSLSSSHQFKEPHLQLSYKKGWSLPFSNKKWGITIANTKGSALYDNYVSVYEGYIPVKEEYISVLPPYGEHTFHYETRVGLFAQNEPSMIRVKTQGVSLALPVSVIRTIITQILFVIGVIVVLGVVCIGFPRMIANLHKLIRSHSQ